ncbi:MAG TPA: hypothetical protein VKY85_11905 [Candidatus Angelobacter sp.]|nr:hypothetical protein [Candidatus Angelobacter sp.]
MNTAILSPTQCDESPGFEGPTSDVAATDSYRLASKFVMRMTGFPTELMGLLSSPSLAAAVDEAREAGENTSRLAGLLLTPGMTDRRLRRHIKKGHPIVVSEWPGTMAEELTVYENSRHACEQLIEQAGLIYQDELLRVRKHLYELARDDRFREVLLMSSAELERMTPPDSIPPVARSSQARQRELTWTSYAQRLATKNETISFFGPCVWGEFDAHETGAAAIELDTPAVDRRIVYVERWTCEALAKLMSNDAEVQPLLPLRLADDALIEPHQATLLNNGCVVPLQSDEWEFLQCCKKSVQRTLSNSGMAESLLERKVLVRDIRLVVSLEPFQELRQEVASWPGCSAQSRWMEHLRAIERARAAVENSFDLNSRREALALLQGAVLDCGVGERRGMRFLYVSRLAVNEECRRNARKVVLGRPVMEQLQNDLAPWFGLWRDLAGLYATRMHAGILPIWEKLGAKPVPLPVFLRACHEQGLPLTVSGGARMWPEVEREVQQAWCDELGTRYAGPEITLTEDQMKFVGKRFKFTRLKAFDNPSPDVQLIATDEDALSDGRWTLLLAESHPDFSVWENCLSIWCPDLEAYAQECRHGAQGTVAVVGAYPPYYSTVHTALSVYPYLHQWTFLGVQGPQGARTLRSAEGLVSMTADDVCLHDYDGRFLGSLLHTWNVAVNTHRLDLRGIEGHMPRLKVGRVIVQRESWVIQPSEEIRAAAETGGYAMFAALRELQATYGLPECVFVKPHSGQKFTPLYKHEKPVFVDFRSPVLVEIFAKMIKNFRKFAVTEMLPRLEDCWLRDSQGHYCCEFRTVAIATPRQ